MVDLLFGNLQEARRRPRQFRYNKVPFELYTDDELHVRFRFETESINLITNLPQITGGIYGRGYFKPYFVAGECLHKDFRVLSNSLECLHQAM